MMPTTMMSSTDRSAYKAVIVLNNIGVTLLQRQRYSDAQATIKDAMDLMSGLRNNDVVGTMTNHQQQEKQSQFLNQASKRIAQSTKVITTTAVGDNNNTDSMDWDDAATGSSSLSSAPSSTSHASPLTVLSQHDVPYNTKELLFLSTSDTSMPSGVSSNYIAHTLEFNGEISHSNNMATDTAILLHNFSVAIRMQLPSLLLGNMNEKKLSTYTKLIAVAYQITKMADHIINEHIEEMDDAMAAATSCHHDYFLQQQQYIESFQISMIIVQDLIVLSSMTASNQQQQQQQQQQCNQKSQLAQMYNYYCSRLGQIRSMLLDIQCHPLDALLRGCPAAKAA